MSVSELAGEELSEMRSVLKQNIAQFERLLRVKRVDIRAAESFLRAAEGGGIRAGKYLPKGNTEAVQATRKRLAQLEYECESTEHQIAAFSEELAGLPEPEADGGGDAA